MGGFSEALAAEVAPLGIKITVVEPGGMRTDWAGASMTTPPTSEPYRATVGASARAMEGFERFANSDPAKVAQLVLTVAALDDPPLRILAGSEAYEYGRHAWLRRVELDANWESLSRSTDDDDAANRSRDQRGTRLPEIRA